MGIYHMMGAQEFEVRSLYHPYSIKAKSSQCNVMTV